MATHAAGSAGFALRSQGRPDPNSSRSITVPSGRKPYEAWTEAGATGLKSTLLDSLLQEGHSTRFRTQPDLILPSHRPLVIPFVKRTRLGETGSACFTTPPIRVVLDSLLLYMGLTARFKQRMTGVVFDSPL